MKVKIDCNNAVTFLKERERMCNSFDYCFKCPLKNSDCVYGDGTLEPEKEVELVQKWSDENPIKTIMDDFLEKYPNAPKEEDGLPVACVYDLGYKTKYSCEFCICDKCEECWNTPMPTETK